MKVPLRVDFAGGWLDVPKFSRTDAVIVNCAISPLVSLTDWPYMRNGGLGGSAAWSILNGKNAIQEELKTAGWQDPAIIEKTGLCVWKSGHKPELLCSYDCAWLTGKMALRWTGIEHCTEHILSLKRDYDRIASAASWAHLAVARKNLKTLALAINLSYQQQLDEGMQMQPAYGALAKKYCGSGHGGYMVYLFNTEELRASFVANVPGTTAVEPYQRSTTDETSSSCKSAATIL